MASIDPTLKTLAPSMFWLVRFWLFFFVLLHCFLELVAEL
jgi:hypothetical protein